MDRTTKTATMAAAFMMAAAGNASAQDLYSERLPLHLELSLSAQTPYKGLIPFGAEIDLNYGFKRFSIHAVANEDYFIPKESVTKNYNRVFNLGGGVGFELFPRKANDHSVFEARLSVTTSIGSGAYTNTSYKIGIDWHAWRSSIGITPTIGIGYNLKDFSKSFMPTYHGGYLTFGIRF
ncbi:MAG: hypothetical protein Q4C37_08900 [Bacteroidales bacterium]|nr:hypothetical protein [Bacteroidales bacterium]